MATRAPFSLRIRRMVITSPATYCLVSIATTLQKETIAKELKQKHGKALPFSLLCLFKIRLPLQVSGIDCLIANGALGPVLVTKRQVVQHARPAEDVSTPGDAGRQRGVEADGARRHLVTVDALQT